MKLKPIPVNTVVHTPAEEDVRELLGILRENGWITNGCTNYAIKNAEGIQIDSETDWSWWEKIESARKENLTIISPADFKRLYCEEEKPQPKFKVGDWVIHNHKNREVGQIAAYFPDEECRYSVCFGEEYHNMAEHQLLPHPEPTTPTEEMETKELNLCKLLKGHEGEWFFNTSFGDVRLEELDATRGQIEINNDDCGSWWLTADGRFTENAPQSLFPSRALYEQYPLDASKAWTKWKEEQKPILMSVTLGAMGDGNTIYKMLQFGTPTDRDKCIEEIKAIIEKYSKK